MSAALRLHPQRNQATTNSVHGLAFLCLAIIFKLHGKGPFVPHVVNLVDTLGSIAGLPEECDAVEHSIASLATNREDPEGGALGERRVHSHGKRQWPLCDYCVEHVGHDPHQRAFLNDVRGLAATRHRGTEPKAHNADGERGQRQGNERDV